MDYVSVLGCTTHIPKNKTNKKSGCNVYLDSCSYGTGIFSGVQPSNVLVSNSLTNLSRLKAAMPHGHWTSLGE